MSPHAIPPADDPARPGTSSRVTIVVDGEKITGTLGQSIAGLMLARDILRLRDTREGRPRGVFCGIGVCFDCLVTVNGISDVRACRRLAAAGDEVLTAVPRVAAEAASAPHVRTADGEQDGGR